MGFREQIRSLALREIENFGVDTLYMGVSPHHDILTSLKNLRVISNEDIEASLEVAVISDARKDFEYLTWGSAEPRYADHLGHNELFAYGLNKGIFSEKELKSILLTMVILQEFMWKDIIIKIFFQN